jgi:hypothetical protein
MAYRSNLAIAVLLAASFATVAQGHGNEERILGAHSEKKIALGQVPAAAMNAARGQLASITKAEQVTTKADGRTLYEIKGKTSAGKTVELFVTPEGQILGSES